MDPTTIECVDCTQPFVFSDTEAAFYAEKGLQRPKRCQSCRTKRRKEREQGKPAQFHDATCTQCGAPCTVPFIPIEGRDVFCKTCFGRVQNPRG